MSGRRDSTPKKEQPEKYPEVPDKPVPLGPPPSPEPKPDKTPEPPDLPGG